MATQQVNNAYAMLLSSEFQGYCRDLHSECVAYLLQGVADPTLKAILNAMALTGRKLDTGNPNPGNIGADFGGFGFRFWDDVYAIDPRNRRRRAHLERLNLWRNAIAHQDFSAPDLGGRTAVQLDQVRQWRGACGSLAAIFDGVMRNRLFTLMGTYPW